MHRHQCLRLAVITLVAWCSGIAAYAQPRVDAGLVEALRPGGYVLVMRHAQSPRQTPTAETASQGNDGLERQLDETGRATAAAMGRSLRALGIPIGPVWSSPTFRALETARHAGFADAQSVSELGDGGGADGTAWLVARAATPPPAGTNSLMITHAPNLAGAFGEHAAGMADGETLILRPDGAGGVEFIARVRIDDWPGLEAGR
jgi:phosphohistidine phosphatase SixA